MWHDIFIANKTALINALDEYSSYLSELRNLISDEDSTKLLGLLGRAQSARKHFGHMLTSTPYTKKLMDPSNTDNSMATSNQASSAYIITPKHHSEWQHDCSGR